MPASENLHIAHNRKSAVVKSRDSIPRPDLLCNRMQRFDEQLRNGAERAFFQDDHCECQAHRRKINRQRREGVAFRHKLQHRSGKDADEPSARNQMLRSSSAGRKSAGVAADTTSKVMRGYRRDIRSTAAPTAPAAQSEQPNRNSPAVGSSRNSISCTPRRRSSKTVIASLRSA